MFTLPVKFWKLMVVTLLVAIFTVIAGLYVLLANSRAYIATLQSDNTILRNDNTLQRRTIATQVFNIHRFNQIAGTTSRNNSIITAGTEKTVIEYREILWHDKNCDFPVPADIADGLHGYTKRLRTSAMHTDPRGTDAARSDTAPPGRLTYCQAVLWIMPLLATIDRANNQLAGIRDIEKNRVMPQGSESL